MITRRRLLGTACAGAVCAPAVVRAVSLMSLRGIIFPTELAYFGYVERVYVHLHLHDITRLQNDGLSAHEIAVDMNRRRWAGHGNAWDADKVIGVVRLNELIQRSDLITRLNIMKGGQ